MNGIRKILFWIFTIALGFVNPLISVALVILYYLPGIIQSACEQCNDVTNQTPDESEFHNENRYSDDVLEEMK